MRRRLLGALALSVGVGAAGCTVGPEFTPPKSETPKQWSDPSANGAGQRSGVTTAAEPDPRWWRAFNDPELDRLVDRAVSGNLDLKQAVLRIAEARGQETVSAAAGLPQIKSTDTYTREQLGLKGLLQEHGAYNLTKQYPQAGPLLNELTQPVDMYQVGFDASWELDLFGRVRRSVEQAQAQTEAQIASTNDALVSLEAEVAQTYAQLRGAQAETATLQDNLRTENDILGLTRNRRQNGLAPQLDVESAIAARASTQALLPQYERQAEQAMNALAVLIGEPPGTLRTELQASSPMPPTPPSVPIGLPASLARRRPDIREAEAQLHAATAGIGVAVAQLFPDVSLTGEAGLRSDRLKYLARWSSLFYSYGPSVSIPIFEGGQLRAQVKIAKAQAAEAALAYRKAVLNALEEVENALVAYRTDEDQRVALANTVAANDRALSLSRNRYQNGVSSFIDVLNAEHNWAQSRQQLIAATLSETTDLVGLYKALGGGWQEGTTAAR
jgi:outer membrane protein, multidrug efflux system